MVSRVYSCVVLAAAVIMVNCRDADRSNDVIADREREREPSTVTPAAKAIGSAGVTSARAAAEVTSSSVVGASVSAASASASAQQPPKEVLNDAQIAAVTDGVNSAEIQQAEVARTKSKHESVRSFAAMMIEHHGEAKRKQLELKLPQAPSALSRQLKQDAKTSLEKLRKAAGAEFDRVYMQAQADGHQTVLEALNRDLIPQAKDTRLQDYLAELKPRVEYHLVQARTGVGALPSGTSSATAPSGAAASERGSTAAASSSSAATSTSAANTAR